MQLIRFEVRADLHRAASLEAYANNRPSILSLAFRNRMANGRQVFRAGMSQPFLIAEGRFCSLHAAIQIGCQSCKKMRPVSMML